MYIYILRRLNDAVRKKKKKKWRTSSWFLFQDNAPAHRSVVVMDFLAKNNVTTLEHSPHTPDMDPADFYMFPRLKSAMRGRGLCDATDSI
jgi:hypothetical protein